MSTIVCSIITERAYVWAFFDGIESKNRQARVKRTMSVNGFRFTDKRSNAKRLAFFADCRIDKRARGKAAKPDKPLMAEFRKAAQGVAKTFKAKVAKPRKSLETFQPSRAKAAKPKAAKVAKPGKATKPKAAKAAKSAKPDKAAIIDSISELLSQLVSD